MIEDTLLKDLTDLLSRIITIQAIATELKGRGEVYAEIDRSLIAMAKSSRIVIQAISKRIVELSLEK